MSKVTLSELDEDGRSLCYSCHYYDWAIVLEAAAQGKWEHVCNSALECKPGDCVLICEGYMKERK